MAFWLGPVMVALAWSASAAIETNLAKAYSVNRKVADFPDPEDMSTPEAAYATLNRLAASGDEGFWRRLSVRSLAGRLPKATGKRPIPAEAAAVYLQAEILEVHLWEKTNAIVIARTPSPRKQGAMDLRHLCLEAGQWLNQGNDVTSSLEDARALVTRSRAHSDAVRLRHSRPPIADPEGHLRPFVEFLKREGG